MYKVFLASDNTLFPQISCFSSCQQCWEAHLASEFVVDEARHCYSYSLVHEACLRYNAVEGHWRHIEFSFLIGRRVSVEDLDKLAKEIDRGIELPGRMRHTGSGQPAGIDSGQRLASNRQFHIYICTTSSFVKTYLSRTRGRCNFFIWVFEGTVL